MIRLFLHRLDEPCRAAPAESVLAPDELERARRFHFPEDRQRWVAGRWWIRCTLGSLLGVPASTLVFSLGKNGKPSMRDAPRGFDFNWSHSSDRVGLVVSDSGPVGIDLEVPRPGFPSLDVARQFFTPSETEALEQADDTARDRLFLRLWTAKEALMKATGAGVSLPPDAIEIAVQNAIPVRYATHPEWQLAHRAGDGWTVAVAWPAGR